MIGLKQTLWMVEEALGMPETGHTAHPQLMAILLGKMMI
jgi:hypothetical protein